MNHGISELHAMFSIAATEILNYKGVGKELDNVEGRKLFDGAFVKQF